MAIKANERKAVGVAAAGIVTAAPTIGAVKELIRDVRGPLLQELQRVALAPEWFGKADAMSELCEQIGYHQANLRRLEGMQVALERMNRQYRKML